VELRGELRWDEPMAGHTTWRVGGAARRFFSPADVDDLCRFLSSLPAQEPLLWLGLGSNLLVRDGGFPGTVLSLHPGLGAVEMLDGHRVRVQAGVPSAKLARRCARAGLGGMEFLAGIPGSFGGALAMNAGAYGGSTWEGVMELETVDRRGHRRLRGPQDYRIGYRSVEGPKDEWFVAAILQLQPCAPERSLEIIRQLLARRAAGQPIGRANAGSVFRNPPGDFAARLIEGCGLKGLCDGGACISEKHANFIVNTGTARAAAIERLMALMASEVARVFGIHLEPEVRVVGIPAQQDGAGATWSSGYAHG
jgi:UDP-N-acetylmuramate dehydrogenase